MGPYHYIVRQIDGDYAHLLRTDTTNGEEILVARALLPDEIDEGTPLVWEDFCYRIEL